ncbi:recombination and repair protein RecN [Escherichia coli]|nr:recombination and repair protein RecN [Escherichia coli]
MRFRRFRDGVKSNDAIHEPQIRSLDKKARLQERARLLGGSEVTRNTLANAKELLAA